MKKSIVETLRYLQQEAEQRELLLPMGDRIAEEYQRDPFLLLVMCLMSLRARDSAVYPVCHKLFARVRTPRQLAALPDAELEAIIRPIGFYRAKAKVLKKVAQALEEWHGGMVPRSEQELLSLPGVGPKTANFMLGWAFNEPALCVDTHVHRLANKFGWVTTKTPEQTERELKKLPPSLILLREAPADSELRRTGACSSFLALENDWVLLNRLLVMWGQQVCQPRLAQKNRPHHDAVCPCMWK